IADDERGRERQPGELARVRPLENGDARVCPQTRMELPVTDVDGGHPGGAPLEENVREAPGRGPDVEAVEPRRIEPERVEGIRQLETTPRDVRRRSLDVQVRRLVDLLPGLRMAGHEAGEDERLRPRPALRQATLDEQDVEPPLTWGNPWFPHGPSPCGRAPSHRPCGAGRSSGGSTVASA